MDFFFNMYVRNANFNDKVYFLLTCFAIIDFWDLKLISPANGYYNTVPVKPFYNIIRASKPVDRQI